MRRGKHGFTLVELLVVIATTADPSRHAARSNHVGGVHGSLVDGSARFFSNDVDSKVWCAMGSTQGGEVCTLGD